MYLQARQGAIFFSMLKSSFLLQIIEVSP